MVFGRRRRELRRSGPATDGPEAEQRIGTRFVMRQKMFAFGDDLVHEAVFTPVRDRFQIDLTVCVDMLAHKGR
jgi:hypothetical protein